MCKQRHKYNNKNKTLLPIASVLTLSAMTIAATPLFASANASVSGQVEVAVDVEPAIAMTITGNNDDGSKHSEPGRSYNSVDNFSPEEIAGSNVDGHSIPATAVTGVSSSYATILPNAVINGSSENGFRSTVTVYTNNAVGYFLTVRDSDNNTNLTHVSGTDYIPTTDNALSAGTAGWNFDVTKFGTRTGDIWAPTADGNDSITVENNAITPTDATIDSLSTKTSNGRTTYVDYNVATSEDQDAGIYSDTLVYTATADAASPSSMSISPSSIYASSASTLTVATPLYTTDGHANTTFYLLTEAQYAEVKSGTDVSQVGGTVLNATRTSSTPVTYTVDVPSISTPGNYYVYADIADFTEDFEARLTVEAPPTKTIADATYFQEVTTCPDTLVEGQEYSLIDQGEPSKSYNAARLADGKCWMTSDYNLSSAAGTLSSANYNVPSGSTFALPTSSDAWVNEYITNQVYNRSGTNGGLYSWYSATAGTNPDSGDSAYDICPKGWRLPTQAEYQTIINNYGSTGAALVASNAKLQYSGSCSSGHCPDYVGSDGNYWSSTAGNSLMAYYLRFGSPYALMDFNNKYIGYSVRCVFGS